jgi:serine/threonine protein kinase
MFEALHFLRQRRPPIAHADVKPDNLLIDERGVLKLTDFGSARVSTPLEDAKADSEERGPGSLLYMSPARLTGSACRCSDDMYSAGVLIGEIVSRCPQESFGTVLALNDENGFTDAVVNGKRPLDYSPVRESLLLNTDLCALAQYCWNADRRKRPAPSAVLDSLELYMNQAKEDEDAEAAAAAAAAAAGGGGGGGGGSPPALRRQHTYSQQQQRKQIAESFDHFDTGEFKVGGGRQIAAEAGFKTLESRKPTRCFSFTLSCTHANQRPLFFHPLFLF